MNILIHNKLLAIFALAMILLLATREENTSYHVQGVDGQPLNDVSYTTTLQREYDAKIKERIEAYNLNNI